MPNTTEITLTTTVREIMTAYPQTEAVFNTHGLTGCGGKKGPLEPIGFFATVHHVDPDQLLSELKSAASEPVAPVVSNAPATEQADIYRLFVKTAMAVVITVGCTLGAVNLAAMALAGVTGSYWEAVTQAHGHAQIFGWVGLFIMGVAYHVLPRLKSTELHARSLAVASFWLVAAGIVLRIVGQPLADSPSFAGIVVLSAICELAAATIFAYVLLSTLRSNPSAADFWDKYVVASAVWFWVTAAATVGISIYAAQRGISVIPLGLDAPYLHVSLMGFAVMMILGITLRTIPVFMGLRTPNTRAFDTIFWTLNASIVLKTGSGWFDALTGASLSSSLGVAGSTLEFGSIVSFVYFLGIFGRRERNVAEEGVSRNYERFIQAAYFWLLVAGSMSAAYAVFQVVAGQPVQHSLVGAYRHALTVGFISLIMMGMAARIIPVFTGVRLHSDLMLLGTFILINVGNTIRVLSQPLADFVGGPFFVTMGISGFIEVMGLSLFVYNLWRTIDSKVEEDVPVTHQTGSITGSTIVADVLASHPEALDILVAHGFTQLRSPIGRRTLARAITLEEACRMKGVSLEAVLADLTRPTPSTPSTTSTPSTDPQVSPQLVTLALRTCDDPELHINIVDLGLVRDVKITGNRVAVRMTLTAPGCPMGASIVEDVRDTLAALPGVGPVTVNLDFDPPWTPDSMSEEAKQHLGLKIA